MISRERKIKIFYISEPKATAPTEFKTPLQKAVYQTLEKLCLPYERVETDEAITMEDCVMINEKLNMKMVKTLFLCNRKQTEFYLFVTAGDKSFKAKEFCGALGVSRVSFAPPALLEKMLGTKIGAATVFSVLTDKENAVQVVFDADVVKEEWYGCSDGTTTCYMKIKTQGILHEFLTYANHAASVIHL